MPSAFHYHLVKRYLYMICNMYWVKELEDAQEMRGLSV